MESYMVIHVDSFQHSLVKPMYSTPPKPTTKKLPPPPVVLGRQLADRKRGGGGGGGGGKSGVRITIRLDSFRITVHRLPTQKTQDAKTKLGLRSPPSNAITTKLPWLQLITSRRTLVLFEDLPSKCVQLLLDLLL